MEIRNKMPGELIQLDGDRAIPKYWSLSADHPAGVRVDLDVEIDPEAGRPRCKRVVVTEAGSGEVTAKTLKAISIDTAIRNVMRTGLLQVGGPAADSGRFDFLSATERAEIYRGYREGARQPRRGSRLTEEELRRVADLYTAALRRGDHPTKVICETLSVARPTASRWVAKARERGLLGPASPGRPSP